MASDTLILTPGAVVAKRELMFPYPAGRTSADYARSGAVLSVGTSSYPQGSASYDLSFEDAGVRVRWQGYAVATGSTWSLSCVLAAPDGGALEVVTSNAPWSASPRIVVASATPLRVAGDGSGAKAVVSFTLPANTIRPDSLAIFKGLLNFPIANIGGTSVALNIGGVAVGSATVSANTGAVQFMFPFYVGPNGAVLYRYNPGLVGQTANTDATAGVAWSTLAARATFGPFPFSGQAATAGSVTTIDFTIDNTLTITMNPTAGSINELISWSLVNESMGGIPVNYAPVTAVAGFGDSLTEGSGSGAAAGLIFSTNGTTDGSTAVITSITTTNVQPNMLVSGTGIPVGSVVVSKTGSTVTLNKATTTGATSSLTFTAGAWPAQLGFQSPGRPYFNGGVAGETAAQIRARMLRDTVRGRLWHPVIWAGRNNVGTATFQADVLADLATMVANLAPGVIPTIVNILSSRTETTGTANNTAILATNAAILARYGINVVDAFSVICTASGAPHDDFLCYTAGSIAANEVHLNDYGYSLVAAAVLAKRVALGI